MDKLGSRSLLAPLACWMPRFERHRGHLTDLSALACGVFDRSFVGNVRLCIVSVWLVLIATQSDAISSETTIQRFIKDAPIAWREYRSRELRLRGTMAKSVTQTINGKLESLETSQDFRIREDWALVIVQRKDDGALAYGTNSRYAFKLTRRGEIWIVDEVAMHGENPSGNLATSVRDRARALLTSGQSLYPHSFRELVEKPGFEVLDANVVKRHGKDLVEVKFRFESKEIEDVQVPKGAVFLDPVNDWLIHEGETEVKWPAGDVGTILTNVTYDDRFSNFRIPKRVSVRMEGRSGVNLPNGGEPFHGTIVLTYDVDETSDPSEAPFKLSAFNLPEPREPTNGFWGWWLLAGILLLVIALFVFPWYGRSRKRTGNAESES